MELLTEQEIFIKLYIYKYIFFLVNRVRLVDHTSYAIDVITKTVNTIEDREWHSLKLPDFVQHVK